MNKRTSVRMLAAILLLGCVLLWQTPGRRIASATTAATEVRDEMPPRGAIAAPRERTLVPEHLPQDRDVSAATVVAPPNVVAPSPECLAARERDAELRAQLAGMSKEEIDAGIEEVARESVDLEVAAMRAADTCAARKGEDRDVCMAAHGAATRAPSAEEHSDGVQLAAALRRQAFLLADRGDARSLAAAAQIMPIGNAERSADTTIDELATRRSPLATVWMIRAQSSGLDDAVVQWAVALFPTLDSGDEPTELLVAKVAARRRLLALEPDNAAAFLLSVSDARNPGQQYSRADLAHAAALPRYRSPIPDLVNMLLEALQQMDISSELRDTLRRQGLRNHPQREATTMCASDADLLREIRLMLAVAGPVSSVPLGPISSCTVQHLAGSNAARDDCLKLSGHLYASGTQLERSVSAARARLIAPAGASRELWEQRHRRYRWRTSHLSAIHQSLDPHELSRIFESAWRRGNENLGIDEMLTRAGIPLEPPPEWQPPDD